MVIGAFITSISLKVLPAVRSAVEELEEAGIDIIVALGHAGLIECLFVCLFACLFVYLLVCLLVFLTKSGPTLCFFDFYCLIADVYCSFVVNCLFVVVYCLFCRY